MCMVIVNICKYLSNLLQRLLLLNPATYPLQQGFPNWEDLGNVYICASPVCKTVDLTPRLQNKTS